MDIDISDILADIQPPTLLPYTPTTHHYNPQTTYTDHILLTRAWTSERSTPALLPYPTTLITHTLDRVRAQISRIEDLTSGVYDGQSGSGSGNSAGDVPLNLNLTLSILQTDLSRTQFLLRSYLRQRLAKVTRYAGYYIKQAQIQSQTQSESHNGTDRQEDNEPISLLSPQELTFLNHHNQILMNYYSSSFLGSLPPGLRRMDDSSGGIARMDEGPDGGVGVLVRCVGEGWGNEKEFERGGDGEGEGVSVELRVERGGILVARWRDVMGGVVGGVLEVL